MADNGQVEYFIDYEYLISHVCQNMEIEGAQNMSVEHLTEIYKEECDNLSKILDFYDYPAMNSSPEKVYVPIIFGLTLIIGLIGNGLVVYVILKSASFKCVTNLFLLNLALADLLFLSICVPFTGIFVALPSWPFGEVMCKIVYYMMIVTTATSILTMTAMTIDRYFAVVMPLQSKSIRTPRRTVIILAAIWIINCLTLIPLLKIYKIQSLIIDGYPQDYCVELFETDVNRLAYYLTIAVLFYLLPLCVIAFAYGLMARSLWAGVSPAFKKVNRAKALRYRKKVAKMMLVVVIVFAVCWFPIHAIHIKHEFFAPGPIATETLLKNLAHCMAYMNSAMNPIIYAFMNENFRKSFKAAFTCRKIKLHMIFLIQDLEAIHIPNKDKKKCGECKNRLQVKPANQCSSSSMSATSVPTPLISTDLNSNSNPEVQQATVDGTVMSTRVPESTLDIEESANRNKADLASVKNIQSEQLNIVRVKWNRNTAENSQVHIHTFVL